LKDSCHSTLIGDYFKYSQDGSKIYATKYSDNKCTVAKEGQREVRGSCNVCTNGQKAYCKTFDFTNENTNKSNGSMATSLLLAVILCFLFFF
jgi:undecaprenyl pyrophosphate synthase